MTFAVLLTVADFILLTSYGSLPPTMDSEAYTLTNARLSLQQFFPILQKVLTLQQSHRKRNKEFHLFPKGINLKENVIARMEYKLIHFEGAVLHFKHLATGNPEDILSMIKLNDSNLYQ